MVEGLKSKGVPLLSVKEEAGGSGGGVVDEFRLAFVFAVVVIIVRVLAVDVGL